MSKLRSKMLGESALLIEWSDEINEENLKNILSLQHWLSNQNVEGIIETWPAFRSLAVEFDNEIITADVLINLIQKHNQTELTPISNNHWLIPVCYEDIFALDMNNVCELLNLDKEEIIRVHCASEYRVHFLGFLPGFMYLGGLNKKLHIPRKSNPDRAIPRGAVALGGSQTGIYPTESPGGWHVIGNSPLNFFDIKSKNPCFIQPGDTVRFESVTIQEFKVAQLESKLDVFDLNVILKNG